MRQVTLRVFMASGPSASYGSYWVTCMFSCLSSVSLGKMTLSSLLFDRTTEEKKLFYGFLYFVQRLYFLVLVLFVCGGWGVQEVNIWVRTKQEGRFEKRNEIFLECNKKFYYFIKL